MLILQVFLFKFKLKKNQGKALEGLFKQNKKKCITNIRLLKNLSVGSNVLKETRVLAQL